MAVRRVERTITLTGTGGPNVTSVMGSDLPSFRGTLRAVEIRYASGDHTFSALTFAIGQFPKNMVAAGIALDAAGRPTTPQSVYADVPGERRSWLSGAVTSGSASAQALCYTETIPGEDRPVVAGPWSLSCQWTRSTGNTSTFVVSLEFDDGGE